MHKENKNNNFIQLFIFFPTVCPMFRRVPWDVVLLTQEPPFWCGTVLSVRQSLTRKRRNCWMNHWTTWTIFSMSLLPFCTLNVVVPLLPMQSQKALGFHQKNLNLRPEDDWTSCRGRVINDRSFIFGWTIPLRIETLMCYGFKCPAFYLSKWWVCNLLFT